MLDDGTKFEVACVHCPMQLVVDGIRQSEIAVMTEHLREKHLELRFKEGYQLGAVLDHFRITPTGRWRAR